VPKQTQANISFSGETADSKLFGQFFIVSDESFHHTLVVAVISWLAWNTTLKIVPVIMLFGCAK
jgi:hypothetical protein